MLFLDANDRKSITEEVEDELLALEEEVSDDLIVMESSSGDLEHLSNELTGLAIKKRKEGPVQKLIGKLFQPQSQPTHLLSPHSSKVAKELELYNAEKPLDLDSDPLTWWNNRRLIYPLMCKLVQKYYAFVATSVPSEHLFNSGNVMIDKRNHLTSEHAAALILLHENY